MVGQVYILGAGKRGDGELGGVPYWLRGGSQKDAGGRGGQVGAWGCRLSMPKCSEELRRVKFIISIQSEFFLLKLYCIVKSYKVQN